MKSPEESPQDTKTREEWGHALGRLAGEDERLLTLFRLMGEVLDPRYETKGIRALVGRSLVDPAFRARVLADADAVLAEIRGHVPLPENVRVRCVENTPGYLTIVLPPPSAALSERSRTLRDAIVSRTSSGGALPAGTDDNDILPFFLDADDGSGGHRDTAHWGDTSHDG
jgi:hypothetical protein